MLPRSEAGNVLIRTRERFVCLGRKQAQVVVHPASASSDDLALRLSTNRKIIITAIGRTRGVGKVSFQSSRAEITSGAAFEVTLNPALLFPQRPRQVAEQRTNATLIRVPRCLTFARLRFWSGRLLPRSPPLDELCLPCPSLGRPAVRQWSSPIVRSADSKLSPRARHP